eukprot:gene1174-1890_t
MTAWTCSPTNGYSSVHCLCMELLLDRGAKVDQPDGIDVTPLYIASQNCHTKCM